jgi:ADP-L-glycero-D-manno-heptose 6-epimerase
VPFPPALVGKYQSYTCADLTRLRSTGYKATMTAAADGVARYVDSLLGS